MSKKQRNAGNKMSTKQKTQEWLDIVKEDLEVADLCFKNDKYLYAAYLCQQAIEKVLKAYITASGETPLPIHDLAQLAEDGGLWEKINSEQRIFLRALSTYAIGARYPERKKKLLIQCNKEEADKILANSKEMIAWLKKEIEEKLSQIETQSLKN